MSTNSSFSPESTLTSRSASEGFSSTSTVGPGDNHKLRIGRVTVKSLKVDEGGPPESRLSGCPLTLSDDSVRELWIVHGIFARPVVPAFSEVRRLCNMCDDRVVSGGEFVAEGVKWRLLGDDEAQTFSSQSSRFTTGRGPGLEGEVMHERSRYKFLRERMVRPSCHDTEHSPHSAVYLDLLLPPLLIFRFCLSNGSG